MRYRVHRAPIKFSAPEGRHIQSSLQQGYRPQIDALRAVAVTSVLYSHFWTHESHLGHHGVRLFFVISGFLITGILLRLKEESGTRLKAKLWTFYGRRTLRIWPTYYLMLLAAWLMNSAGIRSSIGWHAAYLTNYYFIRIGQWSPWVTDHLWSLSVEEQFYLLWPFLVLGVSVRRLPWAIAIAIAVAVAYRLATVVYWDWFGFSDMDIATPGAFDALGMGAALALAKYVGKRSARVQVWLWFAAAASLAAYNLLLYSAASYWEAVYADLLIAIVFTAIVSAADAGVGGWVGTLLEWSPLVFIGRISYGIYLYHLMALYVAQKVAERVGFNIPDTGTETFFVASAITLVAATISWFLIERPLARLKSRLPYAPRSERTDGHAAAEPAAQQLSF